MTTPSNSRREFLHDSLAGAAALGLAAGAPAVGQGIPTRPLGRTGQTVSIL